MSLNFFLLKIFATKALRHDGTKKIFMIKPLCLCALVFLVVYVSKWVNELFGDYLEESYQ